MVLAKKTGWGNFWAIFSQTNLVTLSAITAETPTKLRMVACATPSIPNEDS
jgi:hypothetical protein